MGYFHCLLPNSNRLPLAPLSPACHLLNSRSYGSSWPSSYCGLGSLCLQVVTVATSGPAQSFPARKGWCPAFEHCCFISVRFCWSNYSIMIVWPAHILCASVHTACLLLKVNCCLRKSTCKVQRVVAKEIHQTVFKMHSKGPWADIAMVTQMSSDRHFLEKPWSVPVILVKTNNLHCHWEILHFYGKTEFLEETNAS